MLVAIRLTAIVALKLMTSMPWFGQSIAVLIVVVSWLWFSALGARQVPLTGMDAREENLSRHLMCGWSRLVILLILLCAEVMMVWCMGYVVNSLLSTDGRSCLM